FWVVGLVADGDCCGLVADWLCELEEVEEPVPLLSVLLEVGVTSRALPRTDGSRTIWLMVTSTPWPSDAPARPPGPRRGHRLGISPCSASSDQTQLESVSTGVSPWGASGMAPATTSASLD